MTYSNSGDATPSRGPAPRRTSAWKIASIILVMIVLAIVGLGGGAILGLLKPKHGEAGGHKGIFAQIQDIGQVAINPQQGFPGKDKLVICCMGIDDNWTNSDVVYTNGARTDTLFLLTLDLVTRKATMLSIPRDSYVPIAGTSYSDKINAAYATGGPKRTEATVQQWLNVNPDYYIVLNIDATKRMVDALGGVDVNVEHAMNYDDDWGHLHVHLTPGLQHLDGDNAVAFARYRHGNHGVNPEDGDERRMYRQHVLFQAMIARAKTFSNLLQANQLVDIGMSCIRTDMTRTQLFDLAALFHGINQDSDVAMASLDGQDARGPHGAYIMLVDQRVAQKYTDWLVNGNESVGRELTPVRIANATSTTGLAAQATDTITSEGYTDAHVTSVSTKEAPSQTQIIDSGVANRLAASEIATALGVPNAQILRQPNEPNRFGWTPAPNLKVILGQDYAALVHPQTATAAQ